MVRGGVADRRRQVQSVPREQAVERANLRTTSERRQKDGLGLLPRATNREERSRRAQYNQVAIILLVTLGGITGLATLDMVLTRTISGHETILSSR